MADDVTADLRAAREPGLTLAGARRRLTGHARGYRDARSGLDARAISRTRGEWGLSLYEWAAAVIACAEAEDGCPEPEPAEDGPGRDWLGRAAAGLAAADAPSDIQQARERRDKGWASYQRARAGGDQELITRARQQWASALLAWVEAFTAAEAAADDRNLEERRRQLDLQMLAGAPQDESVQARVASQSRARTRRENLRRDRLR